MLSENQPVGLFFSLEHCSHIAPKLLYALHSHGTYGSVTYANVQKHRSGDGPDDASSTAVTING